MALEDRRIRNVAVARCELSGIAFLMVQVTISFMIESLYELRAPSTKAEWLALHEIRRKVLFENRGKFDTYIENHPDDFKAGHHPLVLLHKGVVIGVVRVEVCGTVAWFRRIAIREDLQRMGHGRVLLLLAEDFAKAEVVMRTHLGHN